MEPTDIADSEQQRVVIDLWKTAQGPWERGVLPTAAQLAHARSSLYNSLPENGMGLQSIQQHILGDVCPAFNGASISPNYYGFVTGGVTPAAFFADGVVSAYDQNVQVHLQDHSIVTDVEFKTLGLLLNLLDLDSRSWLNGTFTTGATASNILGLACGREFVIREAVSRKHGINQAKNCAEMGLFQSLQTAGLSDVQVLSTLQHSSLVKAAGILGIGRANVKSIPSKYNALRIDLEELEAELSRTDVASIMAVSCGEVNTGRFATSGYDDFKQIRQLCDKYGAWLHVDGAFGIFGRLLEDPEFTSIKNGCDGIELADSITGDGHKLLNVPYDCGFFFCRHPDTATQVFQNTNAAYLSAGGPGDGPCIPSPLNIGIENSRRFRALPVYASLLAYGKQEYREMLHRQIKLARMINGWLFDHSKYTPLPESDSKDDLLNQTYMIVMFRSNDDNLNSCLATAINKTSRMFVSGTSWEGAPACRIAISNWKVDVDRDFNLVTDVLESILH